MGRFGQHLRFAEVPEWKGQYVQYEMLDTLVQQTVNRMMADQSEEEQAPLLPIEESDMPVGQERFFDILKEEQLRVELFLRQMLDKVEERQRHLIVHSRHSQAALLVVKEQRAVRREALREYWRMIVMLVEYSRLNTKALAKLCKKYDKCLGVIRGQHFLDTLRAESPIADTQALDQLKLEAEEWYARDFTQGDLEAAGNQLNVEQRQLFAGGTSLFFIGLFSGISIVCIAVSIFLMSTSLDITKLDGWTSVWHTLRFLSLLCFYFWLVGVDVMVWTRVRINYAFMFGFIHERHMRARHYWQIASGMTALLSVFATLYLLGARGFLGAAFPSEYFVLALVLLMLVFLLMPFRIWHRDARFWFLKRIARVVCAPFFAVEFACFWLGDQLTSMVVVLYDLELTVCYFVSDFWTGSQQCLDTSKYARPVLAVAPLWFRFFQEFRRFRDSGRRHHLINAGKYFSGILVVATSTIERFTHVPGSPDDWDPTRVAWLCSVVISTCYTFSWDCYMDWGLWRPRHAFLRKTLLYPKPLYYLSMFVNLCLRFSWTLTLTPIQFGIYKEWMLFCIGAGEIFRRCHWNLYRLENEQISNIGMFRAVKEVPLLISPDTANQLFGDSVTPQSVELTIN